MNYVLIDDLLKEILYGKQGADFLFPFFRSRQSQSRLDVIFPIARIDDKVDFTALLTAFPVLSGLRLLNDAHIDGISP